MTIDYKVTELFCIIDEFGKYFDAENAGSHYSKGKPTSFSASRAYHLKDTGDRVDANVKRYL